MTQKNQFDEKAKTWDERPPILALTGAFSRSIQKNVALSKELKGMEFGCGTGLVTMAIQPGLGRIMMVDSSKGMMDVVAEKIQLNQVDNIDLYCGDIFQAGWQDGIYDLIYSSMTLHHIEDIPSLLKEFARLLKPKGVVCLADLEKEDGSFHRSGGDIPHNGFDGEELKGWFVEAGFQVSVLKTIHHIEKPDADGNLKSYPMFFLKAVKASEL